MTRCVSPSSEDFRRLDDLQQRIMVATNWHMHQLGYECDMEPWLIDDVRRQLLAAMDDELVAQCLREIDTD